MCLSTKKWRYHQWDCSDITTDPKSGSHYRIQQKNHFTRIPIKQWNIIFWTQAKRNERFNPTYKQLNCEREIQHESFVNEQFKKLKWFPKKGGYKPDHHPWCHNIWYCRFHKLTSAHYNISRNAPRHEAYKQRKLNVRYTVTISLRKQCIQMQTQQVTHLPQSSHSK